MQVEDTLSSIWSDIRDETEAAFGNTPLARYFAGSHKDAGEHRAILHRQVGHRGDMTPGDEQDMRYDAGG